MATFRVSRPAREDIARILAASFERWGADGQARYSALLVAAMRKVADRPEGPTTRDRGDLVPGLRSIHLRHVRKDRRSVSSPVHVLYYRVLAKGRIEIVRILHVRMDPHRQLEEDEP